MEVLGDGLHRKIRASVSIQALSRFTQCRLMYRFNIPRTMYVDDNSLNSSLFDHDSIIIKKFNLEATAKDSKPGNVHLIRKKLFLSTFEIKDEVILPIHMRYPPAGKSPFHITDLEYPQLVIDCENNQFENCPKTKFSNARLQPKSKSWVSIKTPTDKIRIEFKGSNLSVDDQEPYFYSLILASTLFVAVYICSI
ncbi:unnamed protein product [Caenorhabditis angaria]|uniref:Phosphatidylinositol-glycan biosynthesis class X protein n=1 Tax=Caenorhabditis angaria TaxID=860376 RepID=A0A9P1N835_9PELO|nr:unnamed protein product [Caenorhabditis angaria]